MTIPPTAERVLRMVGTLAFLAGAVAWVWLGTSPPFAGRVGDLSLFALAYLVLGIALHLIAAAIVARPFSNDGLQLFLPMMAWVATITHFSDSSPLGHGTAQAASILIPLVLVQAACNLLLRHAAAGRTTLP